jgi:hypothetical protein
MSMPPKAFTMVSTAAWTDGTVLISASTAMARPPDATMSAAILSALSRCDLQVRATLAPRAASVRVIASPIPRDPPVTSATLFASGVIVFLPLLFQIEVMRRLRRVITIRSAAL